MIPIIENTYAGKGLYQELLNPLCRKYELTDTQLIILLYLEDNNPADCASMIMRCQRLKKSVVSNSIAQLRERGLISSSFLEGNHKTKHLQVEEKAAQIVEEAKEVQDLYYSILTKNLSFEEKETLNLLLEKVNRNIEGYRK